MSTFGDWPIGQPGDQDLRSDIEKIATLRQNADRQSKRVPGLIARALGEEIHPARSRDSLSTIGLSSFAEAEKEEDDVEDDEVKVQKPVSRNKWGDAANLITSLQFGVNLLIITMARLEAARTSGIYGETFVVFAYLLTSSSRNQIGTLFAVPTEKSSRKKWIIFFVLSVPVFILLVVVELWFNYLLLFEYSTTQLYDTFLEASEILLNLARVLGVLKLGAVITGFILLPVVEWCKVKVDEVNRILEEQNRTRSTGQLS